MSESSEDEQDGAHETADTSCAFPPSHVLHRRIRCEHSTLSLFNRKHFMPPHLAPSFSVPVAPSACLTTRLMISRETNAPDYSRARRPFLIVRGGSRTRIELLLRRRDIGADILRNLQSQREGIIRTRDTVSEYIALVLNHLTDQP